MDHEPSSSAHTPCLRTAGPADRADDLEALTIAIASVSIKQPKRSQELATPASAARPRTQRKLHDEDKENTGIASSGPAADATPSRLACFKALRDELTCAVCLDVCVRPCTTPCGHNYCRSCLRRNLELNRPCPKCRASMPSGFELHINTTLWNTIQHLFPKEVDKPLTPSPVHVKRGAAALGIAHRNAAASARGAFRPPRFVTRNGAGAAGQAPAPAALPTTAVMGLASQVGRSVSGPRPLRPQESAGPSGQAGPSMAPVRLPMAIASSSAAAGGLASSQARRSRSADRWDAGALPDVMPSPRQRVADDDNASPSLLMQLLGNDALFGGAVPLTSVAAARVLAAAGPAAGAMAQQPRPLLHPSHDQLRRQGPSAVAPPAQSASTAATAAAAGLNPFSRNLRPVAAADGRAPGEAALAVAATASAGSLPHGAGVPTAASSNTSSTHTASQRAMLHASSLGRIHSARPAPVQVPLASGYGAVVHIQQPTDRTWAAWQRNSLSAAGATDALEVDRSPGTADRLPRQGEAHTLHRLLVGGALPRADTTEDQPDEPSGFQRRGSTIDTGCSGRDQGSARTTFSSHFQEEGPSSAAAATAAGFGSAAGVEIFGDGGYGDDDDMEAVDGLDVLTPTMQHEGGGEEPLHQLLGGGRGMGPDWRALDAAMARTLRPIQPAAPPSPTSPAAAMLLPVPRGLGRIRTSPYPSPRPTTPGLMPPVFASLGSMTDTAATSTNTTATGAAASLAVAFAAVRPNSAILAALSAGSEMEVTPAASYRATAPGSSPSWVLPPTEEDPDHPDNYDNNAPCAEDNFFNSPFFDVTMVDDAVAREDSGTPVHACRSLMDQLHPAAEGTYADEDILDVHLETPCTSATGLSLLDRLQAQGRVGGGLDAGGPVGTSAALAAAAAPPALQLRLTPLLLAAADLAPAPAASPGPGNASLGPGSPDRKTSSSAASWPSPGDDDAEGPEVIELLGSTDDDEQDEPASAPPATSAPQAAAAAPQPQVAAPLHHAVGTSLGVRLGVFGRVVSGIRRPPRGG